MWLNRIGSVVCLSILAACAQAMSCACPTVGPPTLIIAPQELDFPSVAATPAALTFEYGNVNGSRVTESDSCGTGTSRIVALGAFVMTTSGSASQTVTATSAGSCILDYRNETTSTAVAISVQ
jgi:hypothetical protein